MVRKTKEDAQETRKLILKTALDLFSNRGYSKVTFDEIAKTIGLSKGAVYWHFKNKADLLSSIIREYHDTYGVEFRTQFDSLEELKNNFIKNADQIVKDDQLRKFFHFIFWQIEWSYPLFNAVEQSLSDIFNYPHHYLKENLQILQKNGHISPETDIDIASQSIYSMWHGLLQAETIKNTPNKNFPQTVEKSFNIIIKGLKK